MLSSIHDGALVLLERHARVDVRVGAGRRREYTGRAAGHDKGGIVEASAPLDKARFENESQPQGVRKVYWGRHDSSDLQAN